MYTMDEQEGEQVACHGYYTDTQNKTVTLCSAWYKVTPRGDGICVWFLVPGSLKKHTISFARFFSLLYVFFSTQVRSLELVEAA